MPSPAFPLDPEGLLADSTWLRTLARGLVRDASTADDVAQEAWLAALRSERAADVEHRTWLTGVLRNVAFKHHRAATRRTTREQLSARTEPLPETAELVARADMQRVLTEAVLALDEPFRTTILLRYLEDLTSAEIARRHGVPEGTVRWRVQRGLALLRDELESRRGHEWMHGCALVAGLLSPSLASGSALAAAKSSALAASTKTAAVSASTTLGAATTTTLGAWPAAVLATGLALGGGATAVSAGWIEAPWNTSNGTAGGSEDLVQASVRVASTPDETQPTSPVEVEGGARATTLPRTPLAVRTDSAPEHDGAPTKKRGSVSIEATARVVEGELAPNVGTENRYVVFVTRDSTFDTTTGVPWLPTEALDALADDLTDDERAERMAELKNELVTRGLPGVVTSSMRIGVCAPGADSPADFDRIQSNGRTFTLGDPRALPELGLEVFLRAETGDATGVQASPAVPGPTKP
ncbi:MAG: RNA polymerase sigma factor [Planctomycetota bacterium]